MSTLSDSKLTPFRRSLISKFAWCRSPTTIIAKNTSFCQLTRITLMYSQHVFDASFVLFFLCCRREQRTKYKNRKRQKAESVRCTGKKPPGLSYQSADAALSVLLKQRSTVEQKRDYRPLHKTAENQSEECVRDIVLHVFELATI